MANGEAVKTKVLFLAENPVSKDKEVLLPENVAEKCCFCLPVFGDISDTAKEKNDISSFLIPVKAVTAVTFVLQKLVDGAYSDVATITDNTYGLYLPLSFVTIDGNDHAGLRVDWRNVLSVDGAGTYRIKITITPSFGVATDFFSFVYDLRAYSAIEADETVRFEFWNNNIIGDWENGSQVKNFGSLNWRNMLRLSRSIFGREVSTYEQEEVRFDNGVLVDVQNDQTREFELEIGAAPHFIHKFIKTEILQSDQIYVTDYNSTNPAGSFVDINVKHTGDYAPIWNRNAQEPPVVLTFKLRQNNDRKKLC